MRPSAQNIRAQMRNQLRRELKTTRIFLVGDSRLPASPKDPVVSP